MKAKAKVFVEFRGRKYRLCKGFACKSKRDCSLFVKGVCDSEYGSWCGKLPCEDLASAVNKATGEWFKGGFKEVK